MADIKTETLKILLFNLSAKIQIGFLFEIIIIIQSIANMDHGKNSVDNFNFN